MAKHTGIKKLSNGRFRARYFRGYDAKTGKRVYPAKTFDTEREAREWRAAETSSRSSTIIGGRGVLLSAYLDNWLANKLNLRENSRESYRVAIDTYIKPKLGGIKLSRLTPDHVEEWQADLLKREISGKTVSHARTVLYGALKSAKRKDLVRSNAVSNTDGPKIEKPNRYPLTVDEALAIMAACEGAKHGLAYQLLAHCGLRPEEVAGVKWADLDLSSGKRGVLRVNQVVHQMRGGKWRFHDPKTKSGERVIKFPAETAAKLIEHRKRQLAQKFRMGKLWQDHDLVFTNDIGEPVKQDTLAVKFRRMILSIGLPVGVSMYTLRHFFVSASLIAGVDAKTVSREAGHSKVSFTLDRYGHVLDEMHDAAADKRERLLKNRSGR